jgi:hypothetical protein
MMPTNELKTILKRLRLSGMLESLQDRIAYAKGVKLSYLEFLELVFQDELERRARHSLERRMKIAALDPFQSLEAFSRNCLAWSSSTDMRT